MPGELHSARSSSSTLNSSNVNRFHAGLTTNLTAAVGAGVGLTVGAGVGLTVGAGVGATPAECNSRATNNCLSNSLNSSLNNSQTTLTTTSISTGTASTTTPFLQLSNTSAADLAVAAAAAAAYDFATTNFHHHHHHHRPTTHQTHSQPVTSCASASSSGSSFAAYFNECDNFSNGLSSWEVAHQSAAAFAAASHYHGHQIPSFGAHCDLRSAFVLPNTSCSSNPSLSLHTIPTMTVQKVSPTVRANNASSNTKPLQNATVNTYHATNIINNNNNITTTNNNINPNFSMTAVSKVSKPRRRVVTIAQRRAANIRERRRMFNLNSAFDKLRKKVPTFAYEKRLSRIETLRLAIMYIVFMSEIIRGKDPCFEPRIRLHSTSPFQNHHDHIWNGNHHPFNSHSVFH